MSAISDEQIHASPSDPAEDKRPTDDPNLSDDDLKEIELFIRNSHRYCEEEFGRTFEDENELKELREEIESGNKKIKEIRSNWGLT